MLAVGTTKGGPLRAPSGALATGADGAPTEAKLDDAALQRLSDKAHVPLASITANDDDMRWVQREALHHLAIVKDTNSTVRWKEYGYYLCYPLVLLALLWFRRGWVVRWVFVIGALGMGGLPAPVQAADWRVADWFFTPDQQGRWYYEHRDFAKASEHFDDPYWKGLALYEHARYEEAQKIFATLATPEAKFMEGNCFARFTQYQEAKDAYDQALRMRHPFPQAQANMQLMDKLLAIQEKVPPEDQDDENKPDKVRFDKEGKKGTGKTKVMGKLPQQVPSDVWMRNLNVSPADFLRTKFNIENQAPAPGQPVTPAKETIKEPGS
jgi:Ca-activated chloride channel family protein